MLPKEHPLIATSMMNLADSCCLLGRHEEARVLEEEALAIRKRILPKDHPRIASSMTNLAVTCVHDCSSLRNYACVRNYACEACCACCAVLCGVVRCGGACLCDSCM